MTDTTECPSSDVNVASRPAAAPKTFDVSNNYHENPETDNEHRP